jgi:molecular chaperone DnaK
LSGKTPACQTNSRTTG